MKLQKIIIGERGMHIFSYVSYNVIAWGHQWRLKSNASVVGEKIAWDHHLCANNF